MTEQHPSGTAQARGLFEQLIFNYSSETAVSQPFSKLAGNTNENSFNNHALKHTSNTQHDTNRRNKHNQHNTDNQRRKSTCTTNTMNEYKDADRNAMIGVIHATHDDEVNRIGNPLLNDTTDTGTTGKAPTQHTQRQTTRYTDGTDTVMDKPRLNDGSAKEQQCQHNNTQHTEQQPDHNATAHATHEPHSKHCSDKKQDMHQQHTKTDAPKLPTTIFTKLEEIFCAHDTHNNIPAHTEQPTQSPTTANDNDTTTAQPPKNERNKLQPRLTDTTTTAMQTQQPRTTCKRTKQIQLNPRAHTDPAPSLRTHTKDSCNERPPLTQHDEDDMFEPYNTNQTTNAPPPTEARQDTQSTTHTSWLNTDDYPEWLQQFASNKRTKRAKTSSSTDTSQSTLHNMTTPNPDANQQTAPALTIYNTTFVRKVAPTHSPHLAQPHESWDNSCFGTIDLSQCILTEPSVLTQHDFDAAREHLKNQIRNNPHDHQPLKPAQPRTSHIRQCNTIKPTYNIDRLLNIDTFTTHERLHFLKKSKRHGVGIGTSIIPNAGRGLFTIRDRSDNEYICPYVGAQVEKNSNAPTGQYSYQDTARGIILIGNPATSYGPYANDPLDEQKANCRIAWRQELQEYWLRAQGPIAASTELLLMYGHEFWEWQGSLPADIITKAYPTHLRRPQAPDEQGKC